jgi:putative ABC transport system substrate-binding protein
VCCPELSAGDRHNLPFALAFRGGAKAIDVLSYRIFEEGWMRRRKFIAGLGSAAAWPVVARGQPSALRRIGFLGATSLNESAADVAAFREGLAATSQFAVSSVAIEFRWAEGRYERLPALVTDLIDRQVAVLVTSGNVPPALAAKAATQTTPIVYVMGADPVATGLVANLQRPGKNITGATSLAGELIMKRLELLHDFLPTVRLVALLFNPNNPGYTTAALDEVQKAASALGLRLQNIKASTESDLETGADCVACSRGPQHALDCQGRGCSTSYREQMASSGCRSRACRA